MDALNVSRLFRAPLLSVLALTAGLAAPRTARAADDADAAETAAARGLAVDGVKLAQSDHCEQALEKLEPAEKLKHSPIVLRHVGECQVKVGRWVEGSESLRKLLREPLPADASPALTAAYESATATLRDIKPRIPNMKILLNAPADADVTVKVDHKEVADSVVGIALPTDPGDHEVEATAPGFFKATSSVKLLPSASAFVTLELKRDPNAPRPAAAEAGAVTAAAGAAPAPAPSPATPARAADHGSNTGKVLAYTSYALAAASLGAGIVFGQSARNDEKALQTACPNRVCSEDQKDALDSAKTKGTISTIAFATAGAGLTLGTILLFTSSGSHAENAAGAAERHIAARSRVRAQAKVGLGTVSVVGDF